MAKRRFLPTRRDLFEQLFDEFKQNEEHSNMKRYFLKTKRDFLENDEYSVRRVFLRSIR